MNIFAVHPDPVLAARALCDRHVVKMTLETAQILCTAARRLGHDAPYRSTHAKHPSVLWAAERRANWDWLVAHGLALAAEYERRYGRAHKSLDIIRWAKEAEVGPAPCGRRRQPFAQTMPEEFKGNDPVEAYRRFYRAAKARFARWSPPAQVPRWFQAHTPPQAEPQPRPQLEPRPRRHRRAAVRPSP